MHSEDLSDNGIRLRFDGLSLGPFLGYREKISLEFQLDAQEAPVRGQARLVWAYAAVEGGMVSGWQFVSFEGESQSVLDSSSRINLADRDRFSGKLPRRNGSQSPGFLCQKEADEQYLWCWTSLHS